MERYLSNKDIQEMQIYVPGRPMPSRTIRAALIEMLKKLLGITD